VEDDRPKERLLVGPGLQIADAHSLTSFSTNLTFFPKWFVKCERLSCFWLVSRDGCNELYRQHRFEKILDWGIRGPVSRSRTVSCRLAFERALETEKRPNTQGMIGFQCDDGRVHK
jgi:hypothetical protein